MKLVKCISVAMLAMVMLTGCFEKKIDGSSKAAFDASMQEVKKPLTAQELEEFDNAVKVIGMSSVQGLGDVLLMVSKPENYENFLMKRLDGKTAKQVVQEADEIIKAKGKNEPNSNADTSTQN